MVMLCSAIAVHKHVGGGRHCGSGICVRFRSAEKLTGLGDCEMSGELERFPKDNKDRH